MEGWVDFIKPTKSKLLFFFSNEYWFVHFVCLFLVPNKIHTYWEWNIYEPPFLSFRLDFFSSHLLHTHPLFPFLQKYNPLKKNNSIKVLLCWPRKERNPITVLFLAWLDKQHLLQGKETMYFWTHIKYSFWYVSSLT